jgi:hypothetical protein
MKIHLINCGIFSTVVKKSRFVLHSIKVLEWRKRNNVHMTPGLLIAIFDLGTINFVASILLHNYFYHFKKGGFMSPRDYDYDRGHDERRDDNRSRQNQSGRGGSMYNSRSENQGGRGRSRDDYESTGSSGMNSNRSGDGRGWYGDEEGHSEASQRGWDNRGSGKSRMREDENDYERSGYSNRNSGENDYYFENSGRSNRGSNRNLGEGRGWFGDPEGHSEAAETGWEQRGGGRGPRRNDEYDDDRKRGSMQRTSGQLDQSGSRSDQDGDDSRGWFGDSEGHSRAARKGWRNR